MEKRPRIGYFVKSSVTDPKTGEVRIALEAHNPSAQQFFERLLREETARRRAREEESSSD